MTLTKGQLVMTEHRLAWYLKYCPPNRQYLTKESNHVYLVNNGHYVFVDTKPIPATRAQVEAKVKEMGWEYVSTKYGEWYRKDYVWDIRQNELTKKWGVDVPFINDDTFDTAPAQLAEAILVAKLLNATKD